MKMFLNAACFISEHVHSSVLSSLGFISDGKAFSLLQKIVSYH